MTPASKELSGLLQAGSYSSQNQHPLILLEQVEADPPGTSLGWLNAKRIVGPASDPLELPLPLELLPEPELLPLPELLPDPESRALPELLPLPELFPESMPPELLPPPSG